MHVIILQTSPNRDGLTAACAASAAEGVKKAGGSIEEVRLNDLKVGPCKACDNGWGTCLHEHSCKELDDFQALHQKIVQADGIILISPVYWGEMSESAKSLTDRLRRCEASRNKEREGKASLLEGKPIVFVAAAGGTGNGTITCLGSMERWGQHVHASIFDLIPVNRWTREYKIACIQAAACTMANTPLA